MTVYIKDINGRKPMKAVLINANERKVVAGNGNPDPNKSLDGLRALIGGEWVQSVIVGENLTL